MSVKIINVLKDDTFNDILELFRSSAADEVILVLPKTGKLFRREDHFAAFAAEAKQSSKSVSILTSQSDLGQTARKYGFHVLATPSASAAKPKKPKAQLASTIPSDFSVPDFDDAADLGDVPLTSDQTIGSTDADDDQEEDLSNMHLEDEDGNSIEDASSSDDEAFDGEEEPDFAEEISANGAHPTATLAASPRKVVRRPSQPGALDGVRYGSPAKSVTPSSKQEKATVVPVQKGASLDDAALASGSDYIDTVWRGMKVETAKNFQRVLKTGGGSHWHSSNTSKRVILTMLASAALVLCGVVYLMTGSATVTIVPSSKQLHEVFDVQASDYFTNIDEAFAKIPGQRMDVSKTAEKTVEASGTRDVASKARGKVTFYNSYSSTPQSLVSNTRLGTTDGKIYRTLQSITVPGSTLQQGVLVPGKISVDVIADSPGPEYNIPATDFVIVAFREKGDTNKVANFYGKSEAPMTGGSRGPSRVVTQSDYDAARKQAIDAAKEQVVASLALQGDGLRVINDSDITISDVQLSARVDDAADAVTAKATATLSTIAFRDADLRELLDKTMVKKHGLTIREHSSSWTYSSITMNSTTGTLRFTVTLDAQGYKPIDIEKIKNDIRGKNSDSVRAYFKDNASIESATAALSPFWVRAVPQAASKITVNVNYDTRGGQ